MDETAIKDLLESVKSGATSVASALQRLKTAPFEDLGYAKVDHHRALRHGIPEVIYGEGKTPEQIAAIARSIASSGASPVLMTRLTPEKAAAVAAELPVTYDPVSRIALLGPNPEPRGTGYVAVAAAGTSDLPVAEEAARTAEALGTRVERLYDVGVAGLHRLLAKLDALTGARAVIAVAGMEGALATVVGGLVSSPVIAVPTSVGYGANLQGVTTALAMLTSCASGVTVVNIDNGFGAGVAAGLMIRRMYGEAVRVG